MIRETKYLSFVLPIFFSCWCRPPVQLVFDTCLNTREFCYITQGQIGSTATLTGVYNVYKIGSKSLPALFVFDHRKGTGYILLHEALSCPFFNLVKIGGTVSPLTVLYEGTKAKMSVPALQVTTVELLADLWPVTRSVRSSFNDHYRVLSEKIALSGSRLKLPLQPDWQAAWMEPERRLIYYMRCSDMMYEAEIDVLVNPLCNRVEKIVAWQRFKGE